MIETGRVFYPGDVKKNSIDTIRVRFKTYYLMKPNGYSHFFFYRFFTDKRREWFAECIPGPDDEEQIRKQLKEKRLESRVRLNFKGYLRYFDRILLEHKRENHQKWVAAIGRSIKNML